MARHDGQGNSTDAPDDAAFAALRARVTELHAALVRYAAREMGRARGREPAGMELLRLLVEDPGFAWLRPLSAWMAAADAPAHSRTEAPPPPPAALRDELAALLDGTRPADSFAERYRDALQADPDLVVAHGAVRAALERLRGA